MGNKLSCCWCPNCRSKRCHRASKAESAELEYEYEVYKVASRETISPAALEYAEVDVGVSEANLVQQDVTDPEMPKVEEEMNSKHEWPTKLPVKYEYNSCSTLFVGDSTVTNPHLEDIVECMALAIDHLIKHRNGNRTLDFFDERLHPLNKEKVPEDYFENEPEVEIISQFVGAIFTATNLRAACGLIALIYLERFLSYAEIDICPTNWKRIVLGAILESSIYDPLDQWNVDDSEILKDITIEDINEIERNFCEVLKCNTELLPSTYTRYYFDFYTWAYDEDMILSFHPLIKERAQKLEATGGVLDDDEYRDACAAAMRRSVSADNVIVFQRSSAVIS